MSRVSQELIHLKEISILIEYGDNLISLRNLKETAIYLFAILNYQNPSSFHFS